MESKVITFAGKTYKSFPSDGYCTGCAAQDYGCGTDNKLCFALNQGDDCTEDHIFKDVTDVLTSKLSNKPTIQMNLELDLSNCILPVFFTVKNIRLQSLDTALKNQSDAYNVSVKDLPQETIEVLAEEIKQEFIKRNTKVVAL